GRPEPLGLLDGDPMEVGVRVDAEAPLQAGQIRLRAELLGRRPDELRHSPKPMSAVAMGLTRAVVPQTTARVLAAWRGLSFFCRSIRSPVSASATAETSCPPLSANCNRKALAQGRRLSLA